MSSKPEPKLPISGTQVIGSTCKCHINRTQRVPAVVNGMVNRRYLAECSELLIDTTFDVPGSSRSIGSFDQRKRP